MSPVLELIDKISEEALDYSAPINQLPDSVLAYIFSMVGQYHVFTSARKVCKHWLMLGRDQIIWEEIDMNGKIFREQGVDALHECVRYGKGITRLVCSRKTVDFIPAVSIIAALKYLPRLKTIVTPNLRNDYALMKLLCVLPKLCPDLTELDLTAGKTCIFVTGCATLFKYLRNLKCLKLSLESFTLNARLCAEFGAALQHLEEIHLWSINRGISEECLTTIVKANLRVTTLHFCCEFPTTYESLCCVKEMPFLKSLGIHFVLGGQNLCNSPGEKNNFMAFITEGLTNVTSLSLYGAGHPSGQGCLRDEGMKHAMRNMPQLESIQLHNLTKITNTSLTSIRNNCSRLREITIKRCYSITQGGVFSLIDYLHSSLKTVTITGFRVTPGSLEKLQQRFRHIDFHVKTTFVKVKSAGQESQERGVKSEISNVKWQPSSDSGGSLSSSGKSAHNNDDCDCFFGL